MFSVRAGDTIQPGCRKYRPFVKKRRRTHLALGNLLPGPDMENLMFTLDEQTEKKLTLLGFSFERGGAHTARTMMLEELRTLLDVVDGTEVTKMKFVAAVRDENCLGKRSEKTRTLTYRHLVDLYSLDPSLLTFRALLFFWKRDSQGQPLLALLCAFCRDPLLRLSLDFVLGFHNGDVVSREALEEHLNEAEPDRFSKATLKSTAQNINSTWTQSGHLTGKSKKIRSHPSPTAGSVAYALLLGYLAGARGEFLFRTDFSRLLDCSYERMIELAEEASRKGWIVFKRVGDVFEVLFPGLILEQEMKVLREQD